MGKQHTQQASEPVAPGRQTAKVQLIKLKDILGKHAIRKRFRNKMTYAQRHMKELQKREGIKRASKASSNAIYFESVVAPACNLFFTAIKLVQRSGKSIVKDWHLQNISDWQKGIAPLDPELLAPPKIPRKWRQEYEATHAN